MSGTVGSRARAFLPDAPELINRSPWLGELKEIYLPEARSGMCCKRENTGLIGRSALNDSTLWSLALHETGASSAVQGRHFQPEIIILCLRHYLRWALSLRNLEEIMSKRNLNVDHVTIRRRINVMRRNSVHVVSANYEDEWILARRRNVSSCRRQVDLIVDTAGEHHRFPLLLHA